MGLFICGISYHYCHSVLSEGSVYSICCRGSAVSEDCITTDWKGYSDVHSFSVKESGWLLAVPLCKEDYINWELYSDRALMSCIFREKTVLSTENVYACYLNPGTYYYRGSRWNGAGTM